MIRPLLVVFAALTLLWPQAGWATLLFVSNERDNTVTVLDATTLAVMKAIGFAMTGKPKAA